MIKLKKSANERTDKSLTFYVPIDIHTAVKKLAKTEKRSISSLLLFVVSDYLEKNNLIEGGN